MVMVNRVAMALAMVNRVAITSDALDREDFIRQRKMQMTTSFSVILVNRSMWYSIFAKDL